MVVFFGLVGLHAKPIALLLAVPLQRRPLAARQSLGLRIPLGVVEQRQLLRQQRIDRVKPCTFELGPLCLDIGEFRAQGGRVPLLLVSRRAVEPIGR